MSFLDLLFKPPDIEKLIATRNLKGLTQATKHRKINVRLAAIEALGEIRDDAAVKVLMDLFDETYWADRSKENEASLTRKKVIQALRNIATARSTEALIKIAMQRKGEERKEAIEIIGNIGTARSIEALIQIAMQHNGEERKAVLEKIDNITDERGLEYLITTLQHSDVSFREAAAVALGKIGDKRALTPLLSLLRPENSIHEPSFKTSGNVSFFSEPVDDPFYVEVIRAIGMIGDKQAVSLLYELIRDRSEKGYGLGRRALAALVDALGRMGDENAVEILFDIIEQGENSYEKRAAIDALDLLNWQPDESERGAMYWISKHDWRECISIGAHAVTPLIAALNDNNRYHSDQRLLCINIAEALGEIGDTRAIKPLVAILRQSYEPLYGEEDGEVYAAGAAKEQEHRTQYILVHDAVERALKKLGWHDKKHRP
jgi:HEAT repeat protein